MDQTRESRYSELIEHFTAHIHDPVGPAMQQYAALAEEIFDDYRVGAKIALRETEQEAFEFLGDSVMEGYAPDGVYDLDTAEKIDVYVSSPIVTRAEDQRVTYNPLLDD